MSKLKIKTKIAPILSRVWGQYGYQTKGKFFRKLIFWFSALFFSQNWTNHKKTLKNGCFSTFLAYFECLLNFEQCTKPKNSNSVINFASIDSQSFLEFKTCVRSRAIIWRSSLRKVTNPQRAKIFCKVRSRL